MSPEKRTAFRAAIVLATMGVLVIAAVLEGTFKTLAIHPDAGQVATRLGASAGLAAVTPPLALLALVDFGGAPDVDCRALIADAKLPQSALGNEAAPTVQSSALPGARYAFTDSGRTSTIETDAPCPLPA